MKIGGAKDVIVNITCGSDITIFDANEAVDFIREASGGDVDIIFGIAINEAVGDSMIVTVIATGFDSEDNMPTKELTLKPQVQQRTARVSDTAVEIEVEDIENSEIPSFIRSREK